MAYNSSRFPSSSSSSSYIPLHKTQLHPRLLHTDPPKTRHHKHLLIIITFSLIPFTLFLFSLSRSLHPPSSASYGVIVDISDHRSQILVFRSLDEAASSGTPFDGKSIESKRVGMGLVGLVRDPELVGRVLMELIGFAQVKVPSYEWKNSKVQVMVSGNVVGLSDEVERVLDECRRVLGSSGFLFKDDWASILKGQDEGLYSWLAVNYALGFIGKTPEDTVGVIALGKSSMQISFATREPPVSKGARVITLKGASYNLYTKSLQQYGQDSVWNFLQKQNSEGMTSLSRNKTTMVGPCIPKGYVRTSHARIVESVKTRGAGNFSMCTSTLLTLLNKKQGECLRPPCNMLSQLEKKPHPQQRFFLSSELLGLISKASLPEVESLGLGFCENVWKNLKSQIDVDDIDQSRRCFLHAFVKTLLHNNFGIPFDEKRVEYAAGSTPVDWRLGAFISQMLMASPEKEVENHQIHIVENESITYFLLFAVLLVFVLLAAFFVMKLRKPQLKTIYDLEKGLYIVMRVPR